MTHHEGHTDAAADAKQAKDAHGSGSDPQPANEALPDGQMDDQNMPTTDGEPADGGSAANAGAESQEEGDAAMRAAEEATKDS